MEGNADLLMARELKPISGAAYIDQSGLGNIPKPLCAN